MFSFYGEQSSSINSILPFEEKVPNFQLNRAVCFTTLKIVPTDFVLDVQIRKLNFLHYVMLYVDWNLESNA